MTVWVGEDKSLLRFFSDSITIRFNIYETYEMALFVKERPNFTASLSKCRAW